MGKYSRLIIGLTCATLFLGLFSAPLAFALHPMHPTGLPISTLKGITPDFYEGGPGTQGPPNFGGNPDCADLGFDNQLKYEPIAGDTQITDGVLVFDITITSASTFDWSTNFPISAVIAKGGNDANVYNYIPTDDDDEGLGTPNSAPALSHITACYDDPLIGGVLLPIDRTALLLAGVQSISMWLIPVVAAGVVIGVFVIKRRK